MGSKGSLVDPASNDQYVNSIPAAAMMAWK